MIRGRKSVTQRNTGTSSQRKALKKSSGSSSVIARIRKIGNSRGILLSNQILEQTGLNAENEVIVTADNDRIIIKAAQPRRLNTDLSTWEAQFKAAIKGGDQPDNDLFGGMQNDFDKNEW